MSKRPPTRFTSIIRAKWMFDGCTSLEDMASRAEAVAKQLRIMHEAGVRVSHSVEDDYAFIETKDAKVAKKFDLHKEDLE